MSNTLTDLNIILFEQLKKISDENISDEVLEKEIKRTGAVIGVANVILSNGELALKAAKFKDDMMNADGELPKMLGE